MSTPRILRIRVIDNLTGRFTEILTAQHESVSKLKKIAIEFIGQKTEIRWICLNTITVLSDKTLFSFLKGNHITFGTCDDDTCKEISIMTYSQYESHIDECKAIEVTKI